MTGVISRRDACKIAAGLPLLTSLGLAADPEAAPDTFRAYTDAPRLLLRPARLRLLRRERERRSLRWDQFETLITAGVAFPENGWADALRYQVAENPEAAQRAVAWAISPAATDIRQLALIADWCAPLLSPAQKTAIFTKLARAIAGPAPSSLAEARNKTFAAVVLSEDQQQASENALTQVFRQFWLADFIPSLRSGKRHVLNHDAYALLELLHAFRDNLNFDLRDNFPAWFRQYPVAHIAAHYPAPYPAAENEYRIPADPDVPKSGPDATKAILSRAAELAMVAFDSNAAETQLLQGFLMNDRFLMRSPFGILYEMLWANPYQPGVSYYHVPLAIHDPLSGHLFVRSSWEDDALWIGLFDQQMQLFHDGGVTLLDPKTAHAPIDIDEGTVLFAKTGSKFKLSERKPGDDGVALDDAFLLGLDPKRRYHVEADWVEMRELTTDAAGTLFLPGLPAGVTVRYSVPPA